MCINLHIHAYDVYICVQVLVYVCIYVLHIHTVCVCMHGTCTTCILHYAYSSTLCKRPLPLLYLPVITGKSKSVCEFFPPALTLAQLKSNSLRNLLHLSPSLGHACNKAAPTSNRSENMHVHTCTQGAPLGDVHPMDLFDQPPPEKSQECSEVRSEVRTRRNKSMALRSPSQGSKRIPERVPGTISCPHDRHQCSSCSASSSHPHQPLLKVRA